jgi:flagellar biogenesis protein FliO
MMAFSIAHIVVLALAWWLVQVQRQREHEFKSAAPVDTSSISS